MKARFCINDTNTTLDCSKGLIEFLLTLGAEVTVFASSGDLDLDVPEDYKRFQETD